MELTDLVDRVIKFFEEKEKVARTEFIKVPPGSDDKHEQYRLGRAAGQLILAREIRRFLDDRDFRFEVLE